MQKDLNKYKRYISTHSLTRRLTCVCAWQRCRAFYFNSQPHKEADNGWGLFLFCYAYFNSQPHKEADKCAEVIQSTAG